MTYHPVTKEELEKLMSWSTNKSPQVCQYERRLEILKRIEARPDPLEVLEKWRESSVPIIKTSRWELEQEIIKELRTTPDAVIARGKQEGWLPLPHSSQQEQGVNEG